jgi:CheY-like chemotaxis protein
MQSSRGKTNATILIVDDISTERLILARYLEDLGYRHATATNGVEALQLAESLPIDLILLDLSMPVLNGLELLGELQNDDILRSIPVIVISGSFEQNAVRSIEAGAEDYLRKPFDPVMLRARIQNCLEKKRLRDVQVQHLQGELPTKAGERIYTVGQPQCAKNNGQPSDQARAHRLRNLFDRRFFGQLDFRWSSREEIVDTRQFVASSDACRAVGERRSHHAS